MAPREPPIGAAKFATQVVAAAVLCLGTVIAPGTARAEKPDDPASTVTPTPPVTPMEPATPTEPSGPAATAAGAMTPQAKAHYDRGLQLYGARDFAAAIKELELGFSLEPRREFLFAQAQAFRLAGDCARAVPLYRRFLESDPSALQIEAAQLGLDRCGPNRSPLPAKPAPVARPPSVLRVPAAPVPERHPVWWRDSWAALSIGAGVAALGVGLGFEIASAEARDDAESARSKGYREFARPWESAEQRRAIAVTAAVGGAVFVAAGAARLIFLYRRERATGPSRGDLSFSPARNGGTLVWQGAF